jgi:hypothetical protein
MTPVDELLSGRYRIERMIGQGGMADVFRAVDITGGDPVAVKLVRSADPGLARRFAQEAKALARLEHPGLVRLIDAGVHDEQAFLVMELVEGPTLAARLRRGALSPLRTAMLGRTLAGALAYVHGHGIVHRDVKPANVLLGPGPRVRLADFGIARLAGTSSLTVTGTTLGTAGYMAPEQLEHHDVGPAADVWSLGVILLECLTGQRLFEGTPTEVVARRLAGPVPLPPDLPAPWHTLFSGMLAPDPARRLSAAQVAGLLTADPFAEPWQREPPATEPLAAAAATAPGPGGNGRLGLSGAGAADGGGGRGGDSDGRTGTLVAPVPAPVPPPGPEPSAGRGRRRRNAALVALAVAVLAAGGLTAWALTSGNAPRRGAHSTSTTTSAPTTTSTTAPTTTTTPTASTAAAALVHDAEAGVSAGTLTAGSSKTLLNELNQALSAASSGNQSQASSAVGAMDGTIANEVRGGTMSPSEASTLLADVSALATALGVSPAATTTTTGPSGPTGSTGSTGSSGSTGGGPGPGRGNGGGH